MSEYIGFGRVHVGVPPPTRGVRMAQLRRSLRRLRLGEHFEDLQTAQDVKYIRARLPVLSREMAMKFQTHWLDPKNPAEPDKPRRFGIWRVE